MTRFVLTLLIGLVAVFGDPAAATAKECVEEGVKELGVGAAADVNGALMRTIGDRCVETLKQMTFP